MLFSEFITAIVGNNDPEVIFVSGFLCSIIWVWEILWAHKLIDVIWDGIFFLCKKGFALVKRKFGKEK